MKHATRILLPALFLCLAAGLLTWLTVQPDNRLVGLRPLPPRASEFPELTPPPLTSTLAALETTSLWGLQRNGQPVAPPTSAVKEMPAEKIWSVLGSSVRKTNRFLLIQLESETPIQTKEGETLPDGSTLIKVNANSYVVKTSEGKIETVFITP